MLEGPELHHLRDVCRTRVGQQVELFSGGGLVATALLVESAKRSARLELLEVRTVEPDPMPITVAAAFPKGDRADWLVEKLAELGIARLIPLHTQRTVVEPRSAKLDRLRRCVIEACKQSGRNWLMAIDEPTDYAAVLQTGAGWLLDPTGELLEAGLIDKVGRPARVAIGPEGGWSPAELSQASAAGWKRVALAGHILRIETAAVAIAAVLRLTPAAEPGSDAPAPDALRR